MSEQPAWPMVREWLADATNEHRLIEASEDAGEATLASLEGVTEWSVLGALARNVAVLVVDDWLFVLGAGGDGHPGLRDFNSSPEAPPGALTVAADVLGGSFTINGGGLPCGEPGEVCYLAPDDVDWMPCEMGHSAFVRWALGGDVERFYEELRWPSWRDDVARLQAGQGIHVFPPLWSSEARQGVTRRAVPLLQAWEVAQSLVRQAREQR